MTASADETASTSFISRWWSRRRVKPSDTSTRAAPQKTQAPPDSDTSSPSPAPQKKRFFRLLGLAVGIGLLFTLALAVPAITLAIIGGGFSLGTLLMAIGLAGGMIAGFSYIFKAVDEIRKRGWHIKPEDKWTIAGASLGLGLSIAGSAIGVEEVNFGSGVEALDKVSGGAIVYLGNTGAWASIFNRAFALDRPKGERRVHWAAIGLGILSGSTVIFFRHFSGFSLDQFSGIPGLDVSLGPLGDIPIGSDLLFIAGLTIVSTSFASYSYKGGVHLLQNLFQFVKRLMPSREDQKLEYRDAKMGILLFGLPATAIFVTLSATTSLLPIMPLPGLIFLGIALISTSGGIFSRAMKALRIFMDPYEEIQSGDQSQNSQSSNPDLDPEKAPKSTHGPENQNIYTRLRNPQDPSGDLNVEESSRDDSKRSQTDISESDESDNPKTTNPKPLTSSHHIEEKRQKIEQNQVNSNSFYSSSAALSSSTNSIVSQPGGQPQQPEGLPPSSSDLSNSGSILSDHPGVRKEDSFQPGSPPTLGVGPQELNE